MKVIDLRDRKTNCIILHYPTGTGGKTLGNGLTLSSNSVLQDYRKINYTQQEKYFYLIESLHTVHNSNVWNDLCLTDADLFGFNEVDQASMNDIRFHEINTTFLKVIERELFFVITTHDEVELKQRLLCFPEATVIWFTNVKQLPERYFSKGNSYKSLLESNLNNAWNSISDNSWGECPTNIEQYNNLDNKIKLELETFHDNIILAKLQNSYENWNNIPFIEDCLVFNSTHLHDSTKFLSSCNELYGKLGLESYNEKYIQNYHSLWMKVAFRSS